MRVNDLRKRNWSKTLLPFLAFAGVIGFAMYPVFIYPYFHKEEYKMIQKFNRRDIDEKDIQPEFAVRWSDPFAPKKGEK